MGWTDPGLPDTQKGKNKSKLKLITLALMRKSLQHMCEQYNCDDGTAYLIRITVHAMIPTFISFKSTIETYV